MRKNWFAKSCSLLLAGSMVFSLAACSRDNGQQSTNNEEAKKYVYEYEDLDLGLSGYDSFNVNSLEYQGGKIYASVNAESYGESYLSKQLLIIMNPDGSERTELEIKKPQTQDTVPDGGVTDDMLRSQVEEALPVASTEPGDENIMGDPVGGTDTEGQILTNIYYSQFMVGEEDTILCIEMISTEDYTNPNEGVVTTETNIVCWNMNQEELWRIPLQQYVASEDHFYVQNFLKDSKGNLYVVSDRMCITFDKSGNNIGVASFETEWISRAFIDNEDNLKVLAWNNDNTKQTLAKVDLKTGKYSQIEELDATLSNYNIIKPGLGYDLLMTNSEGLFGYKAGSTGDAGGTNVTQIMSYINSDLNATYLDSIMPMEDGKFVASYWDNTDSTQHISIFTPVAPEDIPDKQAIVIGCNYIDWDVRNRVIQFNKSSKEYRITIKDYSTYNNSEDWNAGVTQLNNDILAGMIPDILIVREDMPIDSYINKGLFADLNEFIDKDEELDKSDYLENVMEAYSVNGKLYRLVPSFNISTCTAKTKWVGDRDVWSIKDMQDVVAQMPEGALAFGKMFGKEDMMQWSLQYTSEQFINKETGKCSFDSQEFKDLLAYISTLPSSQDMMLDDSYWQEYEIQWREDKTLLSTSGIYSIQDFNRIMQGYFGEEYSIVGFPSAPEKGSAISANMSFAISSKSGCTDGAWEFLRYYLTDEYQQSIEWGLPINAEALNQLATKATQKPFYMDESGNKVEYDDTFYVAGNEIIINPLTAEEAEGIVNFIKSVDKTANYNPEIINIINEEAAAFFEGQKPVDEVVKIIQSRVQVYVDENR